MISKIIPYFKFRYLLYVFSFIAGWPCVFFLMGWLPHYTTNYLVLFAMVLPFFFVENKFQIPKPIVVLLVSQIFAWAVYSMINGLDTSYFTRILMLCITYLFLKVQMKYDRLEFVKTYNFWLLFQALAGTLGFFLVLLGILHPIFEFQELDMRPGYFFGLFTTNAYFDGFVRNAGFYDEPGALAFWGIYALLINKLFVNNRRVELLLVFGLISTLSMAYFIQLGLYLFFFYRKKLGKALFIIILFIAALKLISSFNEQMDRSLLGRFEYNEETGTLVGDNRSKMMEACWDIYKTAPILGQGARYLLEISQQRKEFLGANPYFTLACDGAVGQFIIWSPFFYLFHLRRRDKKYGWAFWILIAGFLQRPYECTQLLYPLMSFTIVLQAYLSANNNVICPLKKIYKES